VYIQAVFRETLRHHQPVPRLTKVATNNAVLVGHRFEQGTDPPLVNEGIASGKMERFDVPIPKGSLIVMDFQGVHMNRVYYVLRGSTFILIYAGYW
jgi:hypothetical protein